MDETWFLCAFGQSSIVVPQKPVVVSKRQLYGDDFHPLSTEMTCHFNLDVFSGSKMLGLHRAGWSYSGAFHPGLIWMLAHQN